MMMMMMMMMIMMMMIMMMMMMVIMIITKTIISKTTIMKITITMTTMAMTMTMTMAMAMAMGMAMAMTMAMAMMMMMTMTTMMIPLAFLRLELHHHITLHKGNLNLMSWLVCQVIVHTLCLWLNVFQALRVVDLCWCFTCNINISVAKTKLLQEANWNSFWNLGMPLLSCLAVTTRCLALSCLIVSRFDLR